ncbi:hypothetical protein [Pleurocapsa sp. FMAR1]|uniref:hypothetical protein n=1 Tax=Pleurocapsa sp. FMAR1 TaxID=3040204 RepID=UPI0029C69020|nr:hypothetical protein [Pleurocapsa sp. FMAR1]
MAIQNENYKLEILEYAVNQSINQLLPNSSKDALSVILDQSNEVVWRVATDIHTKSGHQIDFSFIKDILNLRIEPLRNKIAEEERIKAELEIQKRIREAEEQRIRKEKEAEERRIEKAREEEELKKIHEFKEANPNIQINDYKELNTFIRIKNLIIENLEVEEEQITLNTILNDDLGIGEIYHFSWDSSSSNYSDEGYIEGVKIYR